MSIEKKKKVLVSVPVGLLKRIDELAKRAGMDRASFICKTIEAKFFADACREIYSE